MDQPGKKRVRITREQIGDFYEVNEDGVVTQKDPDIIPVLDMSGYVEPDEAKISDEEIEFWRIADEMWEERLTGNTYSRWASYQAMHEVICEQDEYRKNEIRKTFSAIRKRIRLLANPVVDAATFLRSEHARFLTLFDQTDKWGDVALDYTRNQAADIILPVVWEQDNPEVQLFGGMEWTVDKLRKEPAFYWASDDVWTWSEFWNKAQPILNKYFTAIDSLTTIRILQYHIRHCEVNRERGYKNLFKPATVAKPSKNGRGKSKEKVIKFQQIRDEFNNFVKIEGLSGEAAIQEICNRRGCSPTTINRALKEI